MVVASFILKAFWVEDFHNLGAWAALSIYLTFYVWTGFWCFGLGDAERAC